MFEAAKEKGQLNEVAEELGDFALAVRDVPELRAVLRNPELDPETKAGIVVEVIGGADPFVRNLLQLLVEKGRGGEIDEVGDEIERLAALEEGQLTVELTTAFELSDSEASAILKQIQEASGRKVDATRKVDPKLIGGFVLQAGSMRVDASVRGRIERLRRELVST